MDNLIELAVAIVCGAGGLVLFRFLKPNAKKDTQAVIVKVEEKQKENDKLAADILGELIKAQDKIDEINKEKDKDVTNKEIDDFFNKRH